MHDADGLHGPLRRPRQMLAAQTYDGHLSIHDDEHAKDLGFIGAPIEGPTHFSQFDPLLFDLWGEAWFRVGCISSHFKNVVVEGEEVQAHVAEPEPGERITRIWANKGTGELVLEGTASLGPDHPESELDKLMASRSTPEQLVILENVNIGDAADTELLASVGFDQHLGDKYPFTLNQKLEVITEPCEWYSADSPWGGAIVPIEMLSPLVQYLPNSVVKHAKRPVIGLFADLEVRLLDGPILVGEPYRLHKEVVGLGESRRTESMWVKTSVFDKHDKLVATTLLNSASLKNSYADYEKDASRIGKSGG